MAAQATLWLLFSPSFGRKKGSNVPAGESFDTLFFPPKGKGNIKSVSRTRASKGSRDSPASLPVLEPPTAPLQ